jgi:hypothetical protein
MIVSFAGSEAEHSSRRLPGLPCEATIAGDDTLKTAFDAAPAAGISRRLFLALTTTACVVFAAYASTFLYFFVDDEAIPLVYARNLLRGRGLVYTALEGRVEGYSDFLHLVWSAVVLLVTRTLHLSLLAPLLIGKGVSFIAALGIIVVTARWIRRSGGTAAGLAAALGFLALAGPIAVWACSSLEAVIFALMVTAFAAALTYGDSRTAAIVLGAALVVERLDGVVFAVVLIAAAVVADRRRREMAWRVAWPIAIVAIAFHLWRWVFFGSLLSEPLAAKVLYRLTGTGNAVVKEPDVPYLVALLQIYGRPAIVLLTAAVVFAWRAPAARTAAVALLLLGVYVAIVGDWMFGWRFTVPLFPLAALITGMAVSRARPVLGWCMAAVVVVWSGFAARNFVAAYVEVEARPVFWRDPGRGAAAWLAPYYDLVTASRPLVHAGDRVAYNQAGLLPYLLDLENIDDLGICSHFVARLPTTDVYYTAVGRYSPLTNEPVLRTAHAYLLYQNVRFVITPADLLWRANHNSIPDALLDGLFTRVAIDATARNVIYARTSKSADRYRRDPETFTENLAHPSRLTRASIGAVTIDSSRIGQDLPVVREQAQTFDGTVDITLGLGRNASKVSALYIGNVAPGAPGELVLTLFDGAGREVLRRTLAVVPPGMTVLDRFETVAARTAVVSFRSPGAHVRITDLRIEGQSPALEMFVRTALRFPAP